MSTPRSPLLRLAGALLGGSLVLACNQDISLSESARCDGRLQSQEGDTVDGPFDKDGDGYVDGNNEDCVEAYGAGALDCDDNNPDIHPNAAEIPCDGVDQDCDPETVDDPDQDGDGWGACQDCDDTLPTVYPTATEIQCDGLDNDCNEATRDDFDGDGDGWTSCEDCDDDNASVSPSAYEIPCNDRDDDCDSSTPDSEDLDGDGWSSCEDCDDAEQTTHPEADEICDDAVDNDCDEEIDEECSVDYSGDWVLDDTIEIVCGEFFGFYMVEFDFNVLEISDYNPVVNVEAVPGGATQPGTMTGGLNDEGDGTFSMEVENVLKGSCNEIYGITGTFVDADTLTGSFTAKFTGSQCLDCANTTVLFTAERN